MRDLAVNLAASVIAGVAVWLAQWGTRRLRLARRRAFFGLAPGEQALLVVGRHWSSNQPTSVNQRDVAAAVELAAIIRECGARADLAPPDAVPKQLGRFTEFCVGGPTTNPRMQTHLAALLPEVAVETDGQRSAYRIGDTAYAREAGRVEYAILARVFAPGQRRPIFLIPGQTAVTNAAAARYLAAEQRQLIRRYGPDKPFCLVLRLVEPDAYGADLIELVADTYPTAQKPEMGCGV